MKVTKQGVDVVYRLWNDYTTDSKQTLSNYIKKSLPLLGRSLENGLEELPFSANPHVITF